MNKRQKKKLFKQTLIKVGKLHPKEGDVIVLRPDFDWIDVETANQFLEAYYDNKIFDKATVTFVPFDFKQLTNKETAQMFVDSLQRIVDEM